MTQERLDGTPPRTTRNPLSIFRDLKLAWRLFRDSRIPIWTKAIPVFSLAYVIWPIDLLTDAVIGLGQLDDLGVILLGAKLFIGLCSTIPGGSAIVNQLRNGDTGLAGPSLDGEDEMPGGQGEVIDTTYRVLEDR